MAESETLWFWLFRLWIEFALILLAFFGIGISLFEPCYNFSTNLPITECSNCEKTPTETETETISAQFGPSVFQRFFFASQIKIKRYQNCLFFICYFWLMAGTFAELLDTSSSTNVSIYYIRMIESECFKFERCATNVSRVRNSNNINTHKKPKLKWKQRMESIVIHSKWLFWWREFFWGWTFFF